MYNLLNMKHIKVLVDSIHIYTALGVRIILLCLDDVWAEPEAFKPTFQKYDYYVTAANLHVMTLLQLTYMWWRYYSWLTCDDVTTVDSDEVIDAGADGHREELDWVGVVAEPEAASARSQVIEVKGCAGRFLKR